MMNHPELQNTHVALDCNRCRSPEIQVYTDNQHRARSRPECDTADTPLGLSLDRQTDRQTSVALNYWMSWGFKWSTSNTTVYIKENVKEKVLFDIKWGLARYISLSPWSMKHILPEAKSDVGEGWQSLVYVCPFCAAFHWKANLTLICPWNVPPQYRRGHSSRLQKMNCFCPDVSI